MAQMKTVLVLVKLVCLRRGTGRKQDPRRPGEKKYYTNCCAAITRMTPAYRRAAMTAILMFH